MLQDNEIEEKIDTLNLVDNKKWIPVSAKTGKNVKQLKDLIADILESYNSHKFEKKLGVEKTFGN